MDGADERSLASADHGVLEPSFRVDFLHAGDYTKIRFAALDSRAVVKFDILSPADESWMKGIWNTL
jgi:hypothetical protein